MPTDSWQPTAGCVLGMGKLGGQELNYSSDVDVLFVYSEEGSVFKEPPGNGKAPRPVLTNHQFFNRLAEAFIAEVSRMTPEGALYRIDLRLRPEGDAGPLSRSLASYENYYAQWGQTWERMMLIKARGVAGDATLAAEFLETDPAVPLSAVHQRERAARGRGHEGPHRERGGQGRRTGAQREARPRGHSGDRIRGAGAATAARRAAAVSARRADACPRLAKLVQYELLSADESRLLDRGLLSSCATSSIACKWRTICRRTPSRPTGPPRNAWPV